MIYFNSQGMVFSRSYILERVLYLCKETDSGGPPGALSVLPDFEACNMWSLCRFRGWRRQRWSARIRQQPHRPRTAGLHLGMRSATRPGTQPSRRSAAQRNEPRLPSSARSAGGAGENAGPAGQHTRIPQHMERYHSFCHSLSGCCEAVEYGIKVPDS